MFEHLDIIVKRCEEALGNPIKNITRWGEREEKTKETKSGNERHRKRKRKKEVKRKEKKNYQ